MHRSPRSAPCRDLARRADEMLRAARSAEDNPLTDSQMLRRLRREIPAGLNLPESPAEADAVEDLRSIAAGTPLTARQRAALEMWVDGWTMKEIGRSIGVSAATAWRTLRSALLRCWLMGPVPFGEFSRRSIYRPPSHARQGYRSGRRCEVCGAPLWDDGNATTCGAPHCDDVLRMRRRLDRRRAVWHSRRG